MSIHALIMAAEYMSEAIRLTFQPQERNVLVNIRHDIETALRTRGVFIGPGDGKFRTPEPALVTACELTLLFHSGSPWDDEKKNKWVLGIDQIPFASINSKHEHRFEANTKNLCNAVRAALELAKKEKEKA